MDANEFILDVMTTRRDLPVIDCPHCAHPISVDDFIHALAGDDPMDVAQVELLMMHAAGIAAAEEQL